MAALHRLKFSSFAYTGSHVPYQSYACTPLSLASPSCLYLPINLDILPFSLEVTYASKIGDGCGQGSKEMKELRLSFVITIHQFVLIIMCLY